jgi:uncharacterized protein (UPF0332 family)
VHYGGISIDFSWKCYLDLAKELEDSTEEAKLRSSISRAYYAAFCLARNYMIEKDKSKLPFEGSEHQYLIEYYLGYKNHNTNTERKKIANELIRMRNERVKADYHDAFANAWKLRPTAQDIVIRSERVISRLERGGL